MAIKNKNKKGFALLVSVIFMSVMLALGLAISSLGYKQQILASTAVESQYAFYAADAGMECALYADQGQGQNIFAYEKYNASGISMNCDVSSPSVSMTLLNENTSAAVVISTATLPLDNNTHCANVTVYKYKNPQLPTGITTHIFSQGYDVPCSTVASPPNGARFVARGLDIHY